MSDLVIGVVCLVVFFVVIFVVIAFFAIKLAGPKKSKSKNEIEAGPNKTTNETAPEHKDDCLDNLRAKIAGKEELDPLDQKMCDSLSELTVAENLLEAAEKTHEAGDKLFIAEGQMLTAEGRRKARIEETVNNNTAEREAALDHIIKKADIIQTEIQAHVEAETERIERQSELDLLAANKLKMKLAEEAKNEELNAEIAQKKLGAELNLQQKKEAVARMSRANQEIEEAREIINSALLKKATEKKVEKVKKHFPGVLSTAGVVVLIGLIIMILQKLI